MIAERRDEAFWLEIAGHPALAGAVMGLTPQAIAAAAASPAVLPLASDNGGFFFGAMDALGMTRELHTLYRPAGWGREAAQAAKEAFERVFADASVVVTYEATTNPRSRPPRSFGFAVAGPWRATAVGELRAWVLTQAAWEASPARRRFMTCP